MKDQEVSFTGIIDVTRRGVGYFSHEKYSDDIEIAPEELATALNGDEVEISLAGKKRGRIQGKVTKILKRARESFVGTLTQGEGDYFDFLPDDQRFYAELRIPTTSAQGGKNKDKAIVTIERWQKGAPPVGKVREVIGVSGEHETEMRSAVLSRGMKLSFPHEVLAESEEMAAKGLTGGLASPERRDFRGVPTFTIDPDDAKDFDDALSLQTLPDGNIEVGVHIADVTHYVRTGSHLDKEARERATSIYLVDRTIPMLPEALSNDLCSLKPDVDRFTFSAVFVMDKSAHIKDMWIGKTLIHSQKRFTYRSAQDVLDQKAGPMSEELLLLAELGRKLRGKREDKGALAFDTDEVKFELDANGVPLRAYVKERLETMRVIEDWMLLANQEVARFVAEKVKNKKPIEQTFIYRIHDTPDFDRIEELRIFLKALGHELGEGKDIHARDINTLLKKVKGAPEETVVQMATLRSMAKAVYSHKNIGHFSLAFSHYTHFTSPIRRYADVMVHRILEGHLNNSPVGDEELRSYQRAAIYASEREVSAVEAERESVKYKQVEYMSTRIGKEFDGVVTGVTENGLFVAEKETRAEGMVHVSALSDDYYQFARKEYALRGNNTRKTYRMGDPVRVRLLSADLAARRIDWAIVK